MTSQELLDQAVAHHQASRLDAAEQLYRQILSTEPEHFDALHMLGVLFGQRGKVQEAVELIGRAIQMRPEAYEPYTNLAALLSRTGRGEEAISVYARAAEVAPQAIDAQYNYAVALQSAERYERAGDAFAKVVALKPDHVEARSGLGYAMLAQGRLKESEAAYAQAYRLTPTSPVAANNLGNVIRAAGRVDESIGLFKTSIWLRPTFAAAHHNLGHALQSLGELDQAILSYRTTVSYGPDFAEGWYHLGLALFRRERLDEALRALHKAAELRPDHADTHYVLGNTLYVLNRPAQAVEAYRTAVKLRPDFSEAHNNLGNTLCAVGRVEESIEAFGNVIRLRPDMPEGFFNLGNALQTLGRNQEAIGAYRRALELRPTYAEALNNLGNALRSRGLSDEAEGAYRQASVLDPDLPSAQSNLGMALQNQGHLEEAAAAFKRALALDPNFAAAHVNLGNLLKDAGRLNEAIDAYRKAQAISPSPATLGNLLYAMHFHPDYGPRELYVEHLKFNRQFIAPLAAQRQPHHNDPSPDRPLRIGYVSPDFREHPIGVFIRPLLANHDHSRFRIYCYSDVRRETPMTGRLKKLADVWRETTSLSDEQLAQLVRQDGIDILVDLAMHMEGSRLLMFGRKRAPVQVTYLAYCGTTGCEAIDYLLTDPYLAPTPDERPYYVEKPVELRSYWCYTEPEGAPQVGPLPALSAGHVTFGCLNNFAKVSDPAVAAWAAILRNVPNSRLILHTHEGPHRKTFMDKLAAHDIEPGRIELLGYLPTHQYLATYNRIDLALDPFPYPGGTTSCGAVWMGVPFVTLRGQTAVSRGGVSILSQLGLNHFIARDVEQYVRVAVEAARDLPRLAELRATLRDRMKHSALMDDGGFARDVESAYRRMWQAWCQSPEAQQARSTGQGESADQLNARGIALERQGKFEDAAEMYREALALRPNWPEVTFNLANAIFGQGRLREAIDVYRQVIALSPHFPEPYNNMGIALSELGEREESLAAFREAVRLNPGYADGRASLAMALRELGRIEEAEVEARRALELKPDSSSALMSLGNISMMYGRVGEAIELFGRARKTDPSPAAYHNYLFALNFSPDLTPRQIAREHETWERECVLPRVTPISTHANSRDPNRPLRIGYVSPDFREHGVGRFLLPLLANHDGRQFEVYCYASVVTPDQITARLRALSRVWRDVGRLSDAQLAQQIQADQVDILIDLSMHSGGSRLPVFAYKPAPVQVTYMGYAGTTGLRAIDYRLTDIFLDPPDAPPAPFVERPLLVRSHWCYQAADDVPPVSPLPALSCGYVTFGCLNNFAKVNERVLELWRRILQAAPRSRLKIHAYEGPHRRRTQDFFAAGGVSAERVEFAGYVPSDQYLRQYHAIDIGLDPFPFAGATTTCDALYMGVPVVTMPGALPISRAGVSVLSNAGFAQVVARDPEDYLRRAVALANDLPALGAFRQSARDRMSSSRLMNAFECTRDLENALRRAWREWCVGAGRPN